MNMYKLFFYLFGNVFLMYYLCLIKICCLSFLCGEKLKDMENYLKIVVSKTDDVENTLKSFGYEKRSGSAGYSRDKIVIVPKKKWYWFSNDLLGTQTISL